MMGLFPLTPFATVVATTAAAVAVIFRRTRLPRLELRAAVIALAVLVAARTILGMIAVPEGWTARYFANDRWEGTPEWSSEFRASGWTRIDRRIAFRDDTFPAHYLNDPRFDRGTNREISEPLSVEWRGFASVTAPRRETFTVNARGRAEARLDGAIALTVDSPATIGTAQKTVSLDPGEHELVIRYVKPAGISGFVELTPAMDVAPVRPRSGSVAWARLATISLNAMIAALLIVWSMRVLWKVRPWDRSQRVALALFALFGAQGAWQASRFVGRMVSLNALDDWFAYESRARDVLYHGPMMTFGRPAGEGAPYFFHPFYSYFLAAVHAATGETLFGPIFLQFVILAIVAALMWRLAADTFGEAAATIGVAALVVIFELDFVRYYTVTLLTENVYILTVTLMLVPFVRWVRGGRRTDLLNAAFWCGVSTMTRLPMLFYTAPALGLIAIVSLGRPRPVGATVAAVSGTAATWMATIAPVTVRNWIMARRFVLIADVPARVLDLLQNFPAAVSADPYIAQFRGTFASGLKVLAQATWDHPVPMLLFHGRKLGFSLGMIQWFGGYRPHPELVAVSLLYVVMCCLSSRMRQLSMWPIHLFILTHLASMVITIPWNYGYRLVIPPFVYLATLGVSSCWSLLAVRRGSPIVAGHPTPV